MAQKDIKKPADLKFGLTKKQRSWVYTGTFIALVILFFVVNNINGEGEEGPYPPDYATASLVGAGKTAPDFALKSVDGKIVKLSDFKGKVVIIDFWATWCPPCRKGIPDLVDLKKEFGKKGLEVIGVSVDDQRTIEQVPSFVKDKNINYPVVYGDSKVSQNYGGIESIPTSVIVDKAGNIVAQYTGLQPKETYVAQLKKLLK
jgi:cytochrome c biogenesis protein CcmG/thiol:disulfide interchange protein DsbE